ncbi:MAG: hypothetical protein K8R16_08815 [Anaerolineales bacterium]|nr:hypothetical protein [Anaerolineales bacterium]
MKHKFGLLITLVIISTFLVSCGSGEEPPVVEEAAPVVDEAAEAPVDSALKVGETAFSMEQLEGMDTVVSEATNKDGSTTEYTGVLVIDLLNEAGAAGGTVVFIASDGYEAELSLAELEGCADCIVAFDGEELRMVLPGFPGSVQIKGVVEIQVK